MTAQPIPAYILEGYRREQARKLTGEINKLQKAYRPFGNAARLQTATDTEIVLSGPARTGKTLACLHKVWKMMGDTPNVRALMVRKTRANLSETALVTLERDVLGFDHPLVLDGASRAHRSHYTRENGSILVTGGLDKPGKILSSEYDLIYIPQAEELHLADWETLLTRLSGRALPQSQQQIIADCNPASPLHWIYQRALSGSLQLWETSHQDNPLLYDHRLNDWTEYGQEYLRKLSLLTGTQRDRLLLGKWSQAEGIVYPEFDTENIVDTEPNPALTIELAADDGYNDPRAILFIQKTGTEILVFDEIYHSHHLAEQCVGEVLDRCEKMGWPKPEICVGSPEAKEMQERFRRAGIPYRHMASRVNDGIDIVRRLICDGEGVRTLKVHKRCTNLITEITDGYRYPVGGTRNDTEKPLDGNDHACFIAGTKIETLTGVKPIEKILAGEMVLTRNGYKKVIVSGFVGERECITTSFSNGETLTGTPEHLVYTQNRNYIEMHAMRYHDIIETSQRYKEMFQWQRVKLLFTMALSILGIPNLRTSQTEPTLNRAVFGLTRDTNLPYIGKCGEMLMEKFQKAITFIIKMITRFIMYSKTLSVSLAMNTWPIMEKTNRMNSGKPQENELNLFAHSRESGTEVKSGARGIVNLANCRGWGKNRLFTLANIAKRLLKVSNGAGFAFALATVKPDGGITMPLMAKHVSVPFVIKPTSSKVNIKNKAIVPTDVGLKRIKHAVYNLQVNNPDGEGEYFANGILVHNCDSLRYWCVMRARRL